MGSAIALELAKQGKRVLGLERFGPVHDRGSSHGESRIIRQAYFESPDYVPLAIESYEMWRAIEKEADTELMIIVGGLMMGTEESEAFAGSLKSARLHGLKHKVLGAAEIKRRYPVMRPTKDIFGFWEPMTGILRVEDCVRTMINLAVKYGADLRFEREVKGWKSSDSGVKVTAGDEIFEADQLVLSPGAWAPELMDYIPMQPQRVVQHWVQPYDNADAFMLGNFPVHLWEVPGSEIASAGTVFYGMPGLNGVESGVKVAFHNVRESCDPNTVNREVCGMELLSMQLLLEKYLPDLDGEHVVSKTCMYTTTPDGHFVLGRYPLHSAVYLACGFSGHGFKFSPVMAKALVDLMLDGKTDKPIEIFEPNRFDL